MVCKKGINNMPRGWRLDNKWNYKAYEKWKHMLQREYSEKLKQKYKTYKDCTVCERWLLLSNFVEDLPKIEGYDEEKFINGELELDKDIKSNGVNKEYNLDNCMLVSHVENIIQAMKTRNYSDMQGENHPMYGKHHSEETRQKISETQKGEKHPQCRKVAKYDLEMNLINIYNYIKQASEEAGIATSGIIRCCRGEYKTAGGYIWKYFDESGDMNEQKES